MTFVTLPDVARILSISPTSLRVWFGVLSPHIARYGISGPSGRPLNGYNVTDMLALLERYLSPRWTAEHSNQLRDVAAQDKDNQ